MKFKFKLPDIFPAKKKKKLRATAVRKPMRIATTADYDEMAEPNMKLSRALLIVLVLHVVAVSGIIAFNAIKTRQAPATLSASSPASTSSPSALKSESAASSTTVSDRSSSHAESKAPRATAAKADRKSDHGKSGAGESGKVYVVAKGDTPVNIAKKLKVSYDELLAINHIEDPHKLQIGQRLIVPKPPKAKKADE
jgi:LysM repeat protein